MAVGMEASSVGDNPNGILASSQGLRGTSYPWNPAIELINPEWVAAPGGIQNRHPLRQFRGRSGVNNPNGAAGNDASGTGQNNLFKYVAGLNPTNPASVFGLSIGPVAGQPNQKQLVFNPRFPDRTYTVEYRNNFATEAFDLLTAASVTDVGPLRTVVDTNTTVANRFYRVKISYP